MSAILRRAALFFLRVYQLTLSPVLYFLGVRCRHEPTCSHYGMDAFRLHSPLRALRLTVSRVLRCRPGGTSGYDPVPPPRGSRG
ncbi:membrane protein insertion efficiency factor YidD [Parvularcula sp. LCG005]|uniref:membrane protein insertion efficiency factor YidD n=1 Tax=Parvularcula sp. LCG005 TaxID=3078805 RepID=UPI0029426460|nr:membrane protein insertion efficiency factor YidD [Parvularcula sp. LCG005]WOI53890.1 membrane protein insertion efficiency factor YidD [Parvularcula sp. LCG005]